MRSDLLTNMRAAVMAAALCGLVGGCVVAPAGPPPGEHWVAGYYGPGGAWHPGHWAGNYRGPPLEAVEPPGAYGAGRVWVPGFYGPEGGWHPGHWSAG